METAQFPIEKADYMTSKKKLFPKILLLPLAIIGAIFIVRMMMQNKAPLEHEVKTFPERLASVMTVESIPFSARAVAYGNVEPSVSLKYKAEVGGKITYVHPRLKQGGSIPKGTEVLRIEPTTFEISLGQSKAGLANTESSLRQLEAEERTAKSSLDIAKRNLSLGQQEYNRVRTLWDKRLIARSTLDAEQQKVLQLSSTVQDIQGNLDTFKSRRAAINAQIQQSQSTVAEKKDSLSRTSVRLPFDSRIGEVLAEEGAFVSVGAQLFEVLGTNAVEIQAQLSIRSAGQLLSAYSQKADNLSSPQRMQEVMSQIKLDTKVRLVSGATAPSWDAQLLRIGEAIDPSRDTIGFTVQVENPYDGVILGKRPPLLRGLYVAVDFKAPLQNRLVIPRKSLHEGRVYLVNAEDKLEIRPVSVAFVQGDLVVIESGLVAGDRIITSDLVPVISGVPIKAVDTGKEYELFRQQAAGELAL